ncbi:hypothetical protein LJC74_07395, partial [Eubacteriales bacterium OttesenSCG-928-A19]|nr:hypothetical protein [Eubacteriales bacterium OttesenSCG-928-A19]
VRETENAKGETWYVISLGGIKEGYLRIDLVDAISEAEYESARYSVVPRVRKAAKSSSSSSKATAAPTVTAMPTATQSGVVIVSASPSASDTATATASPTAVVSDTVTAWTGTDSYYHSRSLCGTTTLTSKTTVGTATAAGKTKCPTCW